MNFRIPRYQRKGPPRDAPWAFLHNLKGQLSLRMSTTPGVAAKSLIRIATAGPPGPIRRSVKDPIELPARDLFTAEDHRQYARHAHWLRLGHQVAAAQRDVEEELQAGESCVQSDRGRALIA